MEKINFMTAKLIVTNENCIDADYSQTTMFSINANATITLKEIMKLNNGLEKGTPLMAVIIEFFKNNVK